MCKECVRRSKIFKISSKTKAKTHGQVKALAQSFDKCRIVGVHDKPTNIAVEAHLFKIQQARTKKRYDRKTDKSLVLREG